MKPQKLRKPRTVPLYLGFMRLDASARIGETGAYVAKPKIANNIMYAGDKGKNIINNRIAEMSVRISTDDLNLPIISESKPPLNEPTMPAMGRIVYTKFAETTSSFFEETRKSTINV